MSTDTASQFTFAPGTLENALDSLNEKGIRQFSVYDGTITSSKEKLVRFMKAAAEKAPDVLFDIHVPLASIDRVVAEAAAGLYCSLSVQVDGSWQTQKKAFEKRCALLNDMGLVFGFEADCSGLSVKQFREMTDFLLSQYPNHLYLQCDSLKPSAVLSTQDITLIRSLSFALDTFYTSGRAVPWFLVTLQPLRLRPSVFLADFAEWQHCNNCDASSGFDPEKAQHSELETMQLQFLRFKYEEKKLAHVFPAVEDMVRLQGAFSRAAAEGEETVLDLSWTPDDLFSPFAQDIRMFAEEACMEACSVRVFPGEYGPDCQYL